MPSPVYNIAMQMGAPSPQSQPVQTPNFMQQLSQFASTLNGNPQQMVQNLIQSGRMSQQQFQQYAQLANQITGRRA